MKERPPAVYRPAAVFSLTDVLEGAGSKKKSVSPNGIYWVEIPQAGLSIQCGCSADSVKHLIRKGFIATEEKNGAMCETGPNVILLSDLPLQAQRFANLAEFPVLQMLYRQGMIIPNHPNNGGIKPLLVDTRDQIESQMAYIYRGNYGLMRMEELLAAGADRSNAADMLRLTGIFVGRAENFGKTGWRFHRRRVVRRTSSVPSSSFTESLLLFTHVRWKKPKHMRCPAAYSRIYRWYSGRSGKPMNGAYVSLAIWRPSESPRIETAKYRERYFRYGESKA